MLHPPSIFWDAFADQIQRADVVALLALLVSGLSALYARQQAREAAKARTSAVLEARRPLRLELLRFSLDFCSYCGTYYTRYLMDGVAGTRDLVAEIGSFRSRIDYCGPIDMPEVEAELTALVALAWQLQRQLRRLGDQSAVVEGRDHRADEEDEVQRTMNAFAEKREALQAAFTPYLIQA